MMPPVDVKQIAKELRAERRGTAAAADGYVGAAERGASPPGGLSLAKTVG
jgi:hypothetical protein